MRLTIIILFPVLAACNSSSEKDAEIARLKAQLAATAGTSLQRGKEQAIAASTPSVVPSSSPVDPTRTLLTRMEEAYERNVKLISYELKLNVEELIDHEGMILDAPTLCRALHDQGHGRARLSEAAGHRVFVDWFGPEVGTQIWNGQLCEVGKAYILNRPCPTPDALRSAFARAIERNAGLWASVLHKKSSDLLDADGHLADLPAVAEGVRRFFVHQDGREARLFLMGEFGTSLGSAIYFRSLAPSDAGSLSH